MKKLLSIILIALAFAGIAIAQFPVLDQVYEVPWLLTGSRTTTIIADKYMTGLQDTSAIIRIPRGTQSMDLWLKADTGITGIIISDDDSCFIIGYLLPPGGSTANWILMKDTLIEAAAADSGYTISTSNYHWIQVADTFWTEFVYAPSDSAAVARHVGASNLYGRKYSDLQFVVSMKVTDTTGMDGSKLMLRFNSRSWHQEDASSGH